MSVGIYIPGLGQSTAKETVEKYAERYRKELEYSTSGLSFYSKIEKIYFADDQSSLLVRIYSKVKGKDSELNDEIVYTFYDFEYTTNLTEKFEKKNLIYKNLLLLLLVLRKLPILLINIFTFNSYIKRKQTFYIFGVFLVMSLAVIWLIPSLMTMCKGIDIPGLEINKFIESQFFKSIEDVSKFTLVITGLLILLVPKSSSLVTQLATEFTAIDTYIQYGEQSQIIQGNLDALIEQISENEPKSTIQFHTYSFGSIVAIDALFPITDIIGHNTKQRVTLLITVGAPFEFVKGFYPNFYEERIDFMTDKIQWLNVYSLMDAFASNFRKDNKIGDAEFGIINNKEKPINLNYEVARKDTYNPFNFITLKHVKMHQSYWDDSKSGQSCTRLIFNKMKELGYWRIN